MRIWLMKNRVVRLFWRLAVSFRLAHQARLKTDMAVTHLAFDLCAGHQGRYRVDDDDVHCARADQRVGDLESLFTIVGLADEELVDVHTQLAGIARVERMLGVDEGRDTTILLALGDRVEGQSRLAARLRAIDLDDAAPRIAPNAQREVEGNRPARGYRHLQPGGGIPQAHDRALSVSFLDSSEG
jgi:hypothetical protein